MSHWAELDETNKVVRVLVGNNNEEDEGKSAVETLGGTWVKTSYNAKIRYNFAGIGFTYDPIDDAFIAPSPCKHDTLILNTQKRWECSACDELTSSL
jgi:hypothetical protein